MANVDILKIELDTDPLGRGYAAMSYDDIIGSLRLKNRIINIEGTLPATVVANVIDPAEFNTLTSLLEQRVWNILHLGEINPFGIEAAVFISVFGAGSTTIANLQALRRKTVSREEELGIAPLRLGEVQEARS